MSLEEKLAGATRVNLKQIAAEHFTPQYIRSAAGALWQSASMVGDLGMPVDYQMSATEKCLVHHCTRELIDDLWRYSIPTLKQFVTADGRFDLEQALATSSGTVLSKDLRANLDIGQEFILQAGEQLHDNWMKSIEERYKADQNDLLANMFILYRAHAMLIAGGSWEAPTILELTFTSAGRERFDWLHDYPDLSRKDLDEILANSRKHSLAIASKHGIKSSTREQVTRYANDRRELAYVFDPRAREIVFNPALLEEVAAEERLVKDEYYDQTQLVLGCPAKFAQSSLYGRGNMLADSIRFKESVFTELYLATHGRR